MMSHKVLAGNTWSVIVDNMGRNPKTTVQRLCLQSLSVNSVWKPCGEVEAPRSSIPSHTMMIIGLNIQTSSSFLCFVSALHSRCLFVNSFQLSVLFQALLGLWKAQHANNFPNAMVTSWQMLKKSHWQKWFQLHSIQTEAQKNVSKLLFFRRYKEKHNMSGVQFSAIQEK